MCVVCVVCVVCGPDLRGVKIQFVWGGVVWVVRTALPRDRPPAGQPSAGRPKISLFFPSPAPIFVLFLSLGVFSWNFGGVFEFRDPQMSTFGLSGCRVQPRQLQGRRGFTQQPENSKRALSRVPALQKHHQNSTRRPPEREKERKWRWRREEKREILGPPPFGAPTPSGPHPFGATPLHQAKTALTRTTHLRAKNETTRNLPLSKISDAPTKSGPSRPGLAKPKSVFLDRAQLGRA